MHIFQCFQSHQMQVNSLIIVLYFCGFFTFLNDCIVGFTVEMLLDLWKQLLNVKRLLSLSQTVVVKTVKIFTEEVAVFD